MLSLWWPPAFAGAPAPVAAAPAAPAPTSPPWAVEIGSGYNFAVSTKDARKHGPWGAAPEIDMWGIDLTGVYKMNKNHALTLRAGYGYGSSTIGWGEDSGMTKDHYVLNTYNLMPGYRFTAPINEKLSAYIGANVGVISSSQKNRYGGFFDGESWCDKSHNTDFSFAYSAEAGLKYDLCPNTYIFAAYEFSGNTAAPKDRAVPQRGSLSSLPSSYGRACTQATLY